MAIDVDLALRQLVEMGGSDLHLKVPSRPMVRLDGALTPLEQHYHLTPEDTESALREILTDDDKLAEFYEAGEVDFAHAVPGVSHFRVNAFRQRGSISLVCRAIPYAVRTIDELELPPVIRELAEEERGIVLVTG